MATDIATNLLHKATVHGDVHLRNILLRDDREPFFIDYACSGPGHPCFDLVRLESALMYGCFRMTADEQSLQALFRYMLQNDPDEADVARDFPGLLSSVGNRLAIRATILSRRACMRVLQNYAGDLRDYIAVRYLVAAQSLTHTHLQTGIVRAAISALSNCLQ